MNITGKKITLRAIEEADLPKLHDWANNPELQDIMGNIYFPTSLEWHKDWFKRLQGDQNNQRLAITTPDCGLIGISSIINIDWRNRHAWHGIMLGDVDIRDKGYGIDTVMATMRYAFEEMGMERLDGGMIEYNSTSIKFYCEKLGWKIEGEKENYYFHKNRWWKNIVVGITKKQYQKLLTKNNYWDA